MTSERLDLHKQWRLIESITPSMPPEQAVAQVQLFNQIDKERDVVNLPLFEVRKKLLEEYGYNPSDWVFYSNDSSSKSPEEKIAELAKPFPLGIEFLVLPGHFIGGVLYGETPTLSIFGVAKNKYFSFGHSCFIRVKPKQITLGEEMQK